MTIVSSFFFLLQLKTLKLQRTNKISIKRKNKRDHQNKIKKKKTKKLDWMILLSFKKKAAANC